ncbi:MFS transporter [Cryptosporangium japonicum]|uniref:MFS transporter n=1 Tax=Cryptosporangium japonicum TaxID=80872 RepID=A0ABP3E959_9ACTN
MNAQRRVLTVLVVSQVLSGAGLAAGITVGALLAEEMLGSTSLAGVPTALFTAGSALAAVAVGRISNRRGRRPGLALGYLAGALGSLGVLVAAVTGSAALLFVALFVYGAGTATNLQARYAGADLAAPGRRARAVSTVLVATTLGGVVGPNLAAPTGALAASLGAPALAGPFLLGGTAYGLAALVLFVGLRPDPLLAARSAPVEAAVAPGPAAVRGGLPLGVTVMVVTQLVMVAIMTMTPVHLVDHGHGAGAAGLVIAVHVAAMYLPSPVTGWLVDRFGALAVAVASGGTLLASGLVAAAGPSVAGLSVALALLGLGWNFGLVAGTALITDAVPLAVRAKVQGLVDVSIAVSGTAGGLASGVVVAAVGFGWLALVCGVLALAILPVALPPIARGRATAQEGRPSRERRAASR